MIRYLGLDYAQMLIPLFDIMYKLVASLEGMQCSCQLPCLLVAYYLRSIPAHFLW